MVNSVTTNGIENAPSDSVIATASNAADHTEGAFSVSFPSDTYEDSKWKMGLYIESLIKSPEKNSNSHIFQRAQAMNDDVLNPKLFLEDIVALYNLVVLEGKSYTKVLEEEKKGISPALSFKELMEQEFPKARYAIEPFFEAATVNMVSAPPNTWKSWLLFYFSSHIAKGTDALGKFPTEQSKVMIVNEEDSFRAIQDRFNILGITDHELPIYFRVANGSKLETKFIDKLLEELKEKDIKVVIFDSLRAMHEADENDSTAMQRILDQMKRLSREGITVIFTHHHRKKSPFEKGTGAEASRGSSAINAAISGHLSLEEEERDDGLFLVVHHLKSKAGEKMQPFEIRISKTDGKISFFYDGEYKKGEKKVGQTKDKIVEILKDGGWKAIKDFDSMNAGKTVLRQAFASLKSQGVILSITRREAIAKKIPVSLTGKANELYYSLNTEANESIIVNGEIDAEQAFLDY